MLVLKVVQGNIHQLLKLKPASAAIVTEKFYHEHPRMFQ